MYDVLELGYGCGFLFVSVYLLCCDLDEFLEELHTFAEGRAQQHFGHHPLLRLIAALQQLLQRHRVASARVTAQSKVHQLLLQRKMTWLLNILEDYFLKVSIKLRLLSVRLQVNHVFKMTMVTQKCKLLSSFSRLYVVPNTFVHL